MMWLPCLASPKATYGLTCGWNLQVINKASISGNNQTVSICTYENNRSLYVLPLLCEGCDVN
jgi:hypothetical protein